MEEGMFAAIICLSAQASSAKDSGNAHGVAKQQPAGQPVPIDPIVMGAQDRRQLQLRTIGFDLILARLYQGQGHISKKKKKNSVGRCIFVSVSANLYCVQIRAVPLQ